MVNIIHDILHYKSTQAGLEQYSSLLPSANEDACLHHQPIRDKTPIWGGRGGPRVFFLIALLFYWLVRSPCKNSKSYDNPFYGLNRG